MSSSEAPSAKPKSRTPQLSAALVTSLARDLYGLHVQNCQELDSFVDRNYHLKVAAVCPVSNQYITEVCAEGYVLKVLNGQDSKYAADVATEAALLHYVHEKRLGTPRLVPTIGGHHFVFCSFSTEGHQQNHAIVKQNEAEEEKKKVEEKKEEEEEEKKEQHAVRLLEYVPGRPLVTVPLTAHLCFQLGKHAARLNTVLQDFDDSNHEVPGKHWIWKMENLPSLRHLLDVIKDSALKSQISDVIDLMEAKLLNAKAREQFRIGYIHGDYNAHNILVSRSSKEENSIPSPISSPTSPELKSSASTSLSSSSKTSTTARENSPPPPSSSSSSLSASSPEEWGVTGVVDFGDMSKTFVLLEPAVAMSDVMLTCPAGEDPDVYAGHVLSGYLSQMPLSRQEIEMLPLVIRVRFTQHLVLDNHTLSRDPHNHYVSAILAPVQRHFLRLCHTSEDFTLQLWMDVASAWGVKFPES